MPCNWTCETVIEMAARGSSQQQQQLLLSKASNGINVTGMRCVVCGGPFRQPTACDRVSAGLSGASPSSFKWLGSWNVIPANANTRKRGETPAFYTHCDCKRLLQLKLNTTIEHSHIWPIVKQGGSNSVPDGLPASSYGGIAAVLEPYGNRSSTTILSPAFKQTDSWMLHSPLVCTRNAERVLTIWEDKLCSGERTLVRRLSSMLLRATKTNRDQATASGTHTPSLTPSSSGHHHVRTSTSSQAAAASGRAGPGSTAQHRPDVDVIDILLSNECMQDPVVVAKLHLSSASMTARVQAALKSKLRLSFSSSSTEAVISLSMWLAKHAGLLSALELDTRIACCSHDEIQADTAISDALAAAAAVPAPAPNLSLHSFSTTCSTPQLLTAKFTALPCLQHLTHLTVPDLTSDQQVRCLPTRLSSLEVTKSTADVVRLQLISQQCPNLREVRLGYSLWPSKTNCGPTLLDRATSGWVLLPVVELRFIGCRLPRGFTAQSTLEPPFMSKPALGQLANLRGLTRLVFDGCCIDAPVSHFASVLSKLTALRALDLADPSGVLTADHETHGNTPRCFVDSTSTLLQAALRKTGGRVAV